MGKLKDKLKKILIQTLLVALVLACGVGLFKKLASMRKPPVRKERQVVAPLLNAAVVRSEDIQMTVSGHGTVSPKTEIQVIPQVSGRVIACHSDFVNGGFFKAGQALITIDPRDYQFAVENAEAAVASAEVQVDQELAEASVARQEWDLLHPGKEPSSALVLRVPQIRQAKAQLKAAKAQLETAKLNLERTVISIPFDGRVAQRSVDLGQYLMSGQAVATVYGTDVAEIVVPLEDRLLPWFDAPLGHTNGNNPGQDAGAAAAVIADFAGARHTWTGRIVRTEGRIDPASRMVNVVVEVVSPFQKSDSRPPLIPGMFVEVEIKGRRLKDIFRIGRHTVHNGNQVWLARDGKLSIHEVQIVRRDKRFAYVTAGLNDGDVIITSPLDVVTENMKIRTEIETLDEEAKDN